MIMTNEDILQREGSLNIAFDYLDRDKTGYIEKSELAGLLEGFETDEVL